MDEAKITRLADRLLGDVTTAMGVMNVYVGHRLGLFTALAESGAVAAPQLAALTGCAERYVLHCLPQAMVFPGAAGTGTVLRPSTLRAYAKEAGFGDVQVLPIDNPLWRFYRLTP